VSQERAAEENYVALDRSFGPTLRPESGMAAPAVRGWRATMSSIATRALDIAVGGIALLLLSPVMILIAIAIRITSPGPALFRQVRVGYLGSEFVMFKFRTMYRDNDDAIHRAFVTAMLTEGEPTSPSEEGIFKLTDDPRVTRIGAFLRRSSLDELPQLLNVLRGNMSLVGPRPALPWEIRLFKPEAMVRFQVKPGLTGLWQVSGRSTLTMQQAFQLDTQYVSRRSLRLDLAILIRTIPVVLMGRGAE
jgi:lipopolysaccharide/colanic/teichoic acid biosynthesis glycosyltransferase